MNDEVTEANFEQLRREREAVQRGVEEALDYLEFRKRGKRVFPNPLGAKREG